MKLLAFAAGILAASILFTTTPSRAADSDPQVAQLITASGNALGIASLASVGAIRVESTVSAFGLHGTATQWADLKNGRFAESSNLPPVSQADGYDGSVAWSRDDSHLVWNDGGDSDRASEINQAYLLSYALWKPQADGATVTWLGTKTAGNTTYDALSIVPVGSKVPFELWFDRSTHLPAQAHFVNGFTTSTLTFSDYRRVNGLNYPYAGQLRLERRQQRQAQVTSVAFDPPDADTALDAAADAARPTFQCRTARRRRPFRLRSAKTTSTST